MKRKLKPVPRFAAEREERDYWKTHDSADHFDLDLARPAIFPQLKPSLRTISIRLSEALLAELKVLAGKKGIPYQSLMKVMLADSVRKELHRA